MTKEAMFSNSERNLQNVGMDQVKEIIQTVDPSVSNSIIIDEAVGLRRINYCYVDVVSKHVRYTVEKRQFHPREELVEKLAPVMADSSDSPYVELPDRSIMTLIGQSPKVSVSNTIRNTFANLTLKNEVDESKIRLHAEGCHLSNEQPLYLVKELCSMEYCSKCRGAKTLQVTDRKTGALTTETCSECQGTGRLASVGIVNIDVKEHSDHYVLTLDHEIDNLKESTIVSHVLHHSMERYRTLTQFNQHHDQDYDQTLTPYIEELHHLMGGIPATEDIYYQIIPCVEFTYRDILSGSLCKGVILDVIDNPEVVLNLTSGVSKVSTAMKDAHKTFGSILGKIGHTEKSKAKSDLKRSTRLLIAITIADGKVSAAEKALLLDQLRDMDEFTTSEKDEFSTLLGSEDLSFLKESDFKFHNEEKAKETLIRMRQIAEADGETSAQEEDLINKLEGAIR